MTTKYPQAQLVAAAKRRSVELCGMEFPYIGVLIAWLQSFLEDGTGHITRAHIDTLIVENECEGLADEERVTAL